MSSHLKEPDLLSIGDLYERAKDKYTSSGKQFEDVLEQRNLHLLRQVKSLFSQALLDNSLLEKPKDILFSETAPQFALKADHESKSYTLYDPKNKKKMEISSVNYSPSPRLKAQKSTIMRISDMTSKDLQTISASASQQNMTDIAGRPSKSNGSKLSIPFSDYRY